MKRITGDTELYVDVDWPTKTVRLFGAGKSSMLWLTPMASAEYREYLALAEWQLEGVPGESLPAHCPLEVDMQAGLIDLDGQKFTAIQSEHLRAALEEAERMLQSGIGALN